MLKPSEAIELLIGAARARVDLNNDQPFLPPITLDATIEVRAAELIAHYQRRVHELLEANDRYLERARKAETSLAYALDREKIAVGIAKQRGKRLAELLEPTPHDAPLTVHGLADALDAFWNAAISEGRNQGGTASDCASVMAVGISAVARQLRQGAPT